MNTVLSTKYHCLIFFNKRVRFQRDFVGRSGIQKFTSQVRDSEVHEPGPGFSSPQDRSGIQKSTSQVRDSELMIFLFGQILVCRILASNHSSRFTWSDVFEWIQWPRKHWKVDSENIEDRPTNSRYKTSGWEVGVLRSKWDGAESIESTFLCVWQSLRNPVRYLLVDRRLPLLSAAWCSESDFCLDRSPTRSRTVIMEC